MVGKLDPALFPQRVRPGGRRSRSTPTSCARSSPRWPPRSRRAPARARTPEEVAEGFLEIAVENMANAIKHISVQRGYDVTEYTLCCFGGAGGQHACLVADALGMTRVLLHPLAGVLSAYGMGLADVRALRQQAVEARLDRRRARGGRADVRGAGGGGARARSPRRASPPRASTRSARCTSSTRAPTRRSRRRSARTRRSVVAEFERRYRAQYGFLMPGKPLVIEAVAVEAIGRAQAVERRARRRSRRAPAPLAPLAANAHLHRGRVPRRRRSTTATRPAPGRRRRRPGGDPRGERDDGRRAGLARDAHRARRPRARARRGGASARTRSAPPPTRCCSRCSTTCSWRSPSRWA